VAWRELHVMWLSDRSQRVPGPHALPVLGGMLQLRKDPLARIASFARDTEVFSGSAHWAAAKCIS
jgi:hypothetical protein